MLEGDVPSPISLFKDKDKIKPAAPVPAVAEQRDDQTMVLDRDSLLDRPSLKAVPGQPGHLVSCHHVDQLTIQAV